MKRLWKKAVAVVHDADAYGQPISLSYDRRNKFKTKLGGLSTLILGGFMAAYFSFLFWGLFAKSTINYSTTEVVRDITHYPKVLDIAKSGFKITIGISGHSYSFFNENLRKYFHNRP